MIIPITDTEEFSSLCLNAWHQNASFWDKTRIVNSEIKKYIFEYLDTNKNCSVLDIGCGNGWLYKDLVKQHNPVLYTGVDYNEHFINSLKKKYPKNDFFCFDFTQNIPKNLLGKFNVAISCLSLIEMADISIAFHNFRSILSSKGILILVTLNPYFEIIRLSDDYFDLTKDLGVFRSDNFPKYYKKEILIDGKKTGRFYYGVLHTTDQLMKAILKNGFSISNFKEINFTNGAISEPIYQAYTLTT